MNTAIHRALLPCLWLPATLSSPAFAADPVKDSLAGVWPIERLQSEIPSFRVEDTQAKIQSLIYEGEKFAGKPS